VITGSNAGDGFYDPALYKAIVHECTIRVLSYLISFKLFIGCVFVQTVVDIL